MAMTTTPQTPTDAPVDPNAEAIRSADIELAPTQQIKTDHDPFLVAFEEPFDAENPRSALVWPVCPFFI